MSFAVKPQSTGQPILIVGFSARAAAQCAANAGFAPVAIDFCQDRDLIALCQSTFSMSDSNWLDWFTDRFPGCGYLLTGGMEYQPALVESLYSNALGVGVSSASMLAMRSLANWKRWAFHSDVDWPETRSLSELPQIDWVHEPWLIKTMNSAGGLGVEDLDSTTVRSIYLVDKDSCPDRYFQRKIPGPCIGVTFASSHHGSFSVGAVQSLGVPPEESHKTPSNALDTNYQYMGSVGPLILSTKLKQTLDCFANIVGNESNYRGIWQADFILDQDRWTLLEINPRWSASMELLDAAYNLRLVAIHDACIHQNIALEQWNELIAQVNELQSKSSLRTIGKMVAYAKFDIEVTRKQSDDWWSHRWQGTWPGPSKLVQYADIPNPGVRFSPGDPLLTCFASDNTFDAIRDRLSQATAHRI